MARHWLHFLPTQIRGCGWQGCKEWYSVPDSNHQCLSNTTNLTYLEQYANAEPKTEVLSKDSQNIEIGIWLPKDKFSSPSFLNHSIQRGCTSQFLIATKSNIDIHCWILSNPFATQNRILVATSCILTG